jgi:hypothetical protein
VSWEALGFCQVLYIAAVAEDEHRPGVDFLKVGLPDERDSLLGMHEVAIVDYDSAVWENSHVEDGVLEPEKLVRDVLASAEKSYEVMQGILILRRSTLAY